MNETPSSSPNSIHNYRTGPEDPYSSHMCLMLLMLLLSFLSLSWLSLLSLSLLSLSLVSSLLLLLLLLWWWSLSLSSLLLSSRSTHCHNQHASPCSLRRFLFWFHLPLDFNPKHFSIGRCLKIVSKGLFRWRRACLLFVTR